MPPYPLNFAGVQFWPETAGGIPSSQVVPGFPPTYGRYILPIGHALVTPSWRYNEPTKTFVNDTTPGVAINWRDGGETRSLTGEGIFGASYSAIASLTRQLGYPKRGYNTNDDDGNGLVDEFTATELGLSGGDFAALSSLILTRLQSHTHITARAEMLYAILVTGAGPLGSAFSPDDFTDSEVRDTDGDGLLEFVDAWGMPLQFYRWPFYYVTDPGSPQSFQIGSGDYYNAIYDNGYAVPREQQTLDPNQLLMAPGWWSSLVAGPLLDNSSQMSDRANLFQQHFFSLVDPRADTLDIANAKGRLWDRTGYYKRRAYFSKFLILSAGPDGQYGIGSFGLNYGDSAQDEWLTWPHSPSLCHRTPSPSG